MPRPLPPHLLALAQDGPQAVRAHILAAAQRVIDREGLALASTRAVAEEAGLAGGTLYNYFDSHTDLIAQAIVDRARDLADPIADLPARAGSVSVEANLGLFVSTAAGVLDRLVPVIGAAFSDPHLLRAVRRHMADVGPFDDPALLLERYLLAERDLGRVAPDADCRAAAALVVSLCHDDAFHRHLVGDQDRPPSRAAELALIARSLGARD